MKNNQNFTENPLIYEELKSPVTAQLETTYKCTNRCNYCYNSWRGRKNLPKTSLSKEDSFTISKKLVEGEVFEVVLTGGEPLLRRDIVYPCAEYLSSNNVDVGLNTNLILLKEEDIQRIKDSGISRVFASLPSSDERLYNEITETKAFRKAVGGMETLLKNKMPLGINMVVTKTNKHQVYDVGKFLYELGVKYFSATPASPCSFMPRELELDRKEVINTLDELLRIQEDFKMLVDVVEPIPRCITDNSEKYEQFLKRDCAAGKLTIAISPSGKVRPCTHISEEYGDLINEELPIIWNRMKPWREGKYVPENCQTCAEMEICSFGCREAAKIENGSYSGLEPWATKPLKENRKKIIINSPPDDIELRIISNLRFRKEKRGYFVFSPRDHSAIYANEELFKVLSFLSQKEKFKLDNLKKESEGLGLSNIIKYLNTRGLIEKW
ncbi:MAG: radical SAM protein [Nanoarchaeota archaeon]